MVVFCTYCGQSFTRDEHLERHILTHTNIKPFKCFTCHMSFARRDLLQRHYTVHGRDQNNQEGLPPNDGIIPKSAGRTPIACSNCAKTKTKCDKKFPCTRCASRNLRCTLRSTRRISRNVNKPTAPSGLVKSGTASGYLTNPKPDGCKKDTQKPQRDQTSGIHYTSEPHKCNESSPIDVDVKNFAYYAEPGLTGDFDQNVAAALPPSPLADISLFQVLPPSNYDDFLVSTNSVCEPTLSSPCYIDWQTNLAFPYDTKLDADYVSPNFACDSDYLKIYQTDDMMNVLPDLSTSTTIVQTPVMTPKLDAFSSRNENFDSISSDQSSCARGCKEIRIDDFDSVITARDAWSVFRSSPSLPQTLCPQTAKIHLESLEQSMRDYEMWNAWHIEANSVEVTENWGPEIVPIQEGYREKLLVNTRLFLNKALQIHREENSETHDPATSNSPNNSNYIFLPPACILEQFLRAYSFNLEPYFLLAFRSRIDVNESLICCNEKVSSILVLMMLSVGANTYHSVETLSLVGGLIEICRLSLRDLIEKNIILLADPIVLQSALLLTAQAAWSGDKWQMEIAMGQRGIYIAYLRRAGYLTHGEAGFEFGQQLDQSETWLHWSKQEMKSRLFHCWAMLDQELSLFYDVMPLFTITDFDCPMPDAECLWYAKSADDWTLAYQQMYNPVERFTQQQCIRRPLPLRELFRMLLDINSNIEKVNLTALHLRLLLQPLQVLVFQSQQVASYLSGGPPSSSSSFSSSSLSLSSLSSSSNSSFSFSSPTSSPQDSAQSRCDAGSTLNNQLTDVQAWLGRWHSLVKKYLAANAICPIIEASLVLFQMISLNTMIDFPTVEQIVRGEGGSVTEDGKQQQHQQHQRHKHKHTHEHKQGQQLCTIFHRHIGPSPDVREAVYHCERILGLVRTMHRTVRPLWWSGAVYRACLILWTIQSACDNGDAREMATMAFGGAEGAGGAGGAGGAEGLGGVGGMDVRTSTDDDFWVRDGHDVAGERRAEGDMFGVLPGVENANGVISHCVALIEAGAPTRLSEGIRAKLKRLMKDK